MKEEIRARLSVRGLSEMNKRQLKSFRQWLMRVAKELNTEKDMKIFAKNYRATLYK